MTTKQIRCKYLNDRNAQFDLRIVSDVAPDDAMVLIRQGWQVAGNCFQRTICQSCNECRSYRIVVDRFEPSRSQKRAWKRNEELVITIGEARRATIDAFNLYLKFLRYRHETLGWEKTSAFHAFFIHQQYYTTPNLTQEWRCKLNGKTVAISYVNQVPDGLIAMYTYYDPAHRERGLGTYMILSMVEQARKLGTPFVYLGNFVRGCRSMSYKSRFAGSEIFEADGQWHPFK